MLSRLSLALVVAALAAGQAWAGQEAPGVEERPAGRPAATGTAPAAAGAADVSVAVFEQFQQFQSQVEVLTGRVEQLEFELRQAREQERARYVDIDARLKALEQSARQRPAESAAAADTAPAGTDDEKVLFDRGLAQVREKKYDAAIDAFEAQLKQYPRGELASTAMYWLGEMWLAASTPDAAKAGRYFYRVYNEFPKSPRAGTAMYRHGLLQCQDDVPKGRVTLNKVVIQYAGSPDAKLAENALKQQCK